MVIQVLFFGAVASEVGERRIERPVTDGQTAQMVFEQINEEFPQLKTRKLLYSLNETYAQGNEFVRDGDELAIFTAVSGG